MIHARTPLCLEREDVMNIADFVGSWVIQLRDGPGDHGMQKDSTLWIGTGSEYGDTPPFLSEEYAVCVGFAILDENGVVELSTAPPGDPSDPGSTPNQALVLRQTGEQLRWKGYYMQQPLYIYISAAETWTPGGKQHIHLFGATTYGDPEQVGVWGGSGTPPSTPPPNNKGEG
jgi:hypothetical protein